MRQQGQSEPSSLMDPEAIPTTFHSNTEKVWVRTAPSLVIAVDMRDPPDVLQVKTHPYELCLLSASDVLSCNTVPTLLASQKTSIRGKEDENHKKQIPQENSLASPG